MNEVTLCLKQSQFGVDRLGQQTHGHLSSARGVLEPPMSRAQVALRFGGLCKTLVQGKRPHVGERLVLACY